MQARSAAELRALTGTLRDRLATGTTLDALLPEAFAAVREAARRTIGQRSVDEQVMGGVALHLGALAEMKTGEGKTLAITMPAYLNALSGRGVHVLTANDYLAARDAEWMGPVYRALGLGCGLIPEYGVKFEAAQHRAAYAADVTYATASAMAYDYLRDNIAWAVDEVVQRGHHMAIVDEADLILIDEARVTPTISDKVANEGTSYLSVAVAAGRLERDRHYAVDDARRMVTLTDEGIARVEDLLGEADLYQASDAGLMRKIDNALTAKEVLRRDRDYIVADGEIRIVNTMTGRISPDGVYEGGLAQALQVKEHLPIQPETRTVASIRTRAYLLQYERLSALTGVATEIEAYRQAYGLETVRIPTHRPVLRVDRPTAIYPTDRSRIAAAVDEVARQRAAGRPVLLGAGSIAQSEQMSGALAERGIPHEVLNAKNHRDEAEIIARSGRIGAVTVVTRMAGRGVDIRLGGDDTDEHDAVVRNGGLFVLSLDLYETRRLELHMRGRAGRRGDPGESAVYVSVEDASFRAYFSPSVLAGLSRTLAVGYDPMESKMTSRALERGLDKQTARSVQRLVSWVKYDDVIGRQRTEIYQLRRTSLGGDGLHDLHDRIRRILGEVVGRCVEAAKPGREGREQLWAALKILYPIGITAEALVALPQATLTDALVADLYRAYGVRESELGPEILRELERRVYISVIDRCWRDHIQAMDDALNGVNLHSLSGSDHLARFQVEATRLFEALLARIGEETVGYLFGLTVDVQKIDRDAAKENF